MLNILFPYFYLELINFVNYKQVLSPLAILKKYNLYKILSNQHLSIMKHFLLTFLFLFYNAFAFGQNLVTYDFSGLAGSQATTDFTTTAPNVNASPISRGSGLNPNGAGGSMNSNGFSTSATLNTANNDYYEFTLTPNPTFSLYLEQLSFTQRRSGSGPCKL